MTRRRRFPTVGIGILAGLTFAAGCDSSSDEPPDTTTTTTDAESTTTTSAADTTTTTGEATTGEATTSTIAGSIDPAAVEGPAEWVPTVVDVYNRIYSLDVEPDPARVAEVFSEQYESFQSEVDTQTFLASEGLHAEGQPPRIVRVEGPIDQEGGTALFAVTIEYFNFQLVRADGSIFQDVTDAAGQVQELLRISPSGPGGTYRVLMKVTA